MTRWNEQTARWTIPIGRWNPKILWWTILIDRFRKNAEKTRVQAYCMNPFTGGWGQCSPGGQRSGQSIVKQKKGADYGCTGKRNGSGRERASERNSEIRRATGGIWRNAGNRYWPHLIIFMI